MIVVFCFVARQGVHLRRPDSSSTLKTSFPSDSPTRHVTFVHHNLVLSFSRPVNSGTVVKCMECVSMI